MARIVPWEQSNDSTVTPIVSSRTDCRPVYRKNKVIEFIIHLSRVQVLSGAILWGKRYERDAETTCEMLTAVDKSLTICGSLIQETKLLQTMWHYLAIKKQRFNRHDSHSIYINEQRNEHKNFALCTNKPKFTTWKNDEYTSVKCISISRC